MIILHEYHSVFLSSFGLQLTRRLLPLGEITMTPGPPLLRFPYPTPRSDGTFAYMFLFLGLGLFEFFTRLARFNNPASLAVILLLVKGNKLERPASLKAWRISLLAIAACRVVKFLSDHTPLHNEGSLR